MFSRRDMLAVSAAGAVMTATAARAASFGNPDQPPEGAINAKGPGNLADPEGDIVVFDALRERKPAFSPEDVVEDFSETLKSYRVNRVCGDRYAAEWPVERFKVHGISYEPAAKPKSDLYRDMLPLIRRVMSR
jgi:hypothetical protein